MLLAGIDWPISSSTFYPFGQEAQSSTDTNRFRFATLERDAESGLDHAMFRQYSSTQGRWMSPDPYNGSYDFSNPQSFNRYAYVKNNPLSMVDPSGLSGVCVNAFPYGTAEPDQYTVNPLINNSADCAAAYGTWVETGSDVTVDVSGNGTGSVADPGIGAIAIPPSSSTASSGGGGGASNVYIFVPRIGMLGPSPQRGCDQVARATQAAVHATATAIGNLKGTGTKLMASLKATAPYIGVYSETGATLLGASEATAATVGAWLSGAAEAIGSATAAYAVTTGVVDFYKQITDPMNGCPITQ